MNTKVKGDKIKEGSIPLSALSNDVKYVTGFYDVVARFNSAGTYQFNFSDYYFCKVVNKFVSLSGINNGQDIQIYDGPPVYIKYEYNGQYSTCVITDVAGYISEERPVEIVTIEKGKDVFIPDTVLKTTPQSLSDTDKNQALANLGIADLLEALKPVRLSAAPPVGNVTQEQLDEIGLTEKVINNIVNGYTDKIHIDTSIYYVTYVTNVTGETEFAFATFQFEPSATLNALMQYKYYKNSSEIIIEYAEL